MAFKLKLDANGNAVIQDGKPVYVNEEGKEEPFDMNMAWNKIHALNEENKAKRLEAETLKAKYKAFDGMTPEEIAANKEAAAKLKEVELIKNKDFETFKNDLLATTQKKVEETERSWKSKFDSVKGEAEKFSALYNDTVLENHFLNSEYIKSELVPSFDGDVAKAYFGHRFRVDTENKRVYAVGEDGSPILSEKKLGNVASFDEAMELLIKNHPKKDAWLKSKANPGGGMNSGGRGNANTPEGQKLENPNTTPIERLNAARKVAAMRGN